MKKKPRKSVKKNREQTSARVAQAAGRLLQPSQKRLHALDWLKRYIEIYYSNNDAKVIQTMLRDGVTVAGSALTQRPNKQAK